VCMKGCICFEQSLSCTDLCPLPSWRLMPQWKYPPSNI
jgi:hypothetical protein